MSQVWGIYHSLCSQQLTYPKKLFSTKKRIRVSGYRFRYQLTCPLCTSVFLDFLGNALQLFWGPLTQKTANMSQFLQLGPLDFDPDLGYVRYFGGIDSANNHSHISKPHHLNNTDTLSGCFPWLVIQPLVNATCFWNAPPIFLPTHEHHL